MRIVAGIDKISDILPLIESGANDFFCGLLSNNQVNHRPNNSKYNLETVEQLKQVIELVHKNNGRVFLVFNEMGVINKGYSSLIKKIKDLDKINLDAIIVTNTTLIELCKRIKINTKIHLSSLAFCSNSESIKFYQNLDVDRIIIPQQIAPIEFEQMFKKIKNIETEVFFHLYNYCYNIDGICRYHQRQLINFKTGNIPLVPCIFKPKINTFMGLKSQHVKKIEQLLKTPPKCNYLEWLYDFYKLGVGTVKLGIRGFPIEEKIRRVKYLKELISFIDSGVSKNDFIKKAKKIDKKYNNTNWNEKKFLSHE